MRLFLADAGKVGFAVKGDDIVSVFKRNDSKARGVTRAILPLAVANGGTRLDCFDTQLPHLYSMSGFRAVARCAFNPQFAPEGWDVSRYADYNGGHPDVVFMVYDPGHGPYKPGDGKMFPDYDSAAEFQQNYVKSLGGKGKAMDSNATLQFLRSLNNLARHDPKLAQTLSRPRLSARDPHL